VSLLAARLLVRSPLPTRSGAPSAGMRGSWFVSGRRSYFDQLLARGDFPYHLTDLQGHLSVETRGGGRLSFTGYRGRDVLDLSDFQAPGAEDESSILRVRWNWGNNVDRDFAGSSRSALGGWLDSRLGYTTFDEALGFVDFDDVRFSSRDPAV
jgi:hypothetical protein